MNHFRLLAMGTMLMFALISPAQQTTAGSADTDKQNGRSSAQDEMPSVDQHLKILTEKLGLSIHQQAKLRPVIQQMFDDREKLTQDTSLSNEAREEKEKTLHEKADKQARKFLNDDQKKKLDQLEQEPHS